MLSLLECSKSEFDNYKEDARIRKEIYDAVHGIPKIQTYQYVESLEISEQRLEITKNQHSKINIKELLDTFPDESELSAFLKKICLFWQKTMHLMKMNIYAFLNFLLIQGEWILLFLQEDPE